MDFETLCNYFEKLSNTSKRLEKIEIISQILLATPNDLIERIVILLQGKVLPIWDNRKLGISSRQIINIIKTMCSKSVLDIENEWKKTGDLGLVAMNLLKSKNQQTLFSIKHNLKEIFDTIVKLTETVGENSTKRKQAMIANIYSNINSIEAKYLTRILLENMQMGVGPGTIKDSIIWAFLPKIYLINYNLNKDFVKENKKNKDKIKEKLVESGLNIIDIDNFDQFEKNYINADNQNLFYSKDEKLLREIYNFYSNKIENAYQLTNQYSIIINTIKEKGFFKITKLNSKVMNPIKAMLFLKAKNIEHAFENVGKPAAFEFKYDGFRVQLHKKQNEIKLYTRQFEDVTNAFPDVIKDAKEHIKANEIICDCEIVGIDINNPEKILPFQKISKRIKRKHNIDQIIKEVPVRLFVFDIMLIDQNSLLNISFENRRKILEENIIDSNKIQKSKMLISENINEVEQFYKKALDLGNEGIMAKKLNGIYKPGNRVGFGMKIKPTMEPLDFVITGATWGEGKRANWMTSFTLSCKDDESDELLEMGKVGTGFKEITSEEENDTDISFEQMTELLKPHIKKENGKEIEIIPTIVIEVNYEEIQKSENYNSGYALRFPRLSRLKSDRDPYDISPLSFITDLYDQQN